MRVPSNPLQSVTLCCPESSVSRQGEAAAGCLPALYIAGEAVRAQPGAVPTLGSRSPSPPQPRSFSVVRGLNSISTRMQVSAFQVVINVPK